MRIKVIFIINLVLLSANVCLAKVPDWFIRVKRIVPSQTTEKEIESLFGQPVKSYSVVKEYRIQEGLLFIYYSSGRCSEKNSSVVDYYDIEKGVVTDAHFRVDKKVKIKSLKLNLTEFLREEADDAPGAIGYSNFDLGISYSTYKDLLNYIILIPPKSLAYLECPKE